MQLTGSERKDEHKDYNAELDPSVSGDEYDVGEDGDEDEDPFLDLNSLLQSIRLSAGMKN